MSAGTCRVATTCVAGALTVARTTCVAGAVAGALYRINLLDRVLTQGLKASTLSRAARTPNAMLLRQCQDYHLLRTLLEVMDEAPCAFVL